MYSNTTRQITAKTDQINKQDTHHSHDSADKMTEHIYTLVLLINNFCDNSQKLRFQKLNTKFTTSHSHEKVHSPHLVR